MISSLSNRWSLGGAAVVVTLLGGAALGYRGGGRSADEAEPSCCAAEPAVTAETSPPSSGAAPAVVASSRPMVIPDTPLVDQNGRAIRFHTDLVKGRVVAINFVFTTCNGVCPPMGTIFGQLRRHLGDRPVQLISVSLDPANDTPARLAAWAERFGAGPNWTLVTGERSDVDGLLRALGAFSAEKTNHAPLVLIGDDESGEWRRLTGLTSAETIKESLDSLLAKRDDSPGHRYFGDVPLVNQYGETMRLYSDLMRDKVVVIHVFFSECKNTCPVMLATDQKIQEHLGDRLGRDVNLIALTVDPANDRPGPLADYARRLKARRGWYLLTGNPEDTELALRRLGQAVGRREEHANLYLMGNLRTGLWKKVQGLAPAEQVIAALDGVIDDSGSPAGEAP